MEFWSNAWEGFGINFRAMFIMRRKWGIVIGWFPIKFKYKRFTDLASQGGVTR